MLFYWYDPQYLNATYKLDQVKLPPRFTGCQDDETQGRRPEEVRVRVPDVRPAEVLQQEVRDERLARRQVPEEVEVDERRPERGRRPDRREAHGPGQGGGEVGQGEPGKVKAWTS